jgi:hypothetical protein
MASMETTMHSKPGLLHTVAAGLKAQVGAPGKPRQNEG